MTWPQVLAVIDEETHQRIKRSHYSPSLWRNKTGRRLPIKLVQGGKNSL